MKMVPNEFSQMFYSSKYFLATRWMYSLHYEEVRVWSCTYISSPLGDLGVCRDIDGKNGVPSSPGSSFALQYHLDALNSH